MQNQTPYQVPFEERHHTNGFAHTSFPTAPRPSIVSRIIQEIGLIYSETRSFVRLLQTEIEGRLLDRAPAVAFGLGSDEPVKPGQRLSFSPEGSIPIRIHDLIIDRDIASKFVIEAVTASRLRCLLGGEVIPASFFAMERAVLLEWPRMAYPSQVVVSVKNISKEPAVFRATLTAVDLTTRGLRA